MPRVFKVLRNEINLPLVVIILGILIGIYHIFSYMIPFTDNAFVVTNVTPIAADVSGYITNIYVKNGQKVKAGDPLFIVYQEPYRLAYEQAKSKYEEALAKIKVIERQVNKSQFSLQSTQFEYGKAAYEYGLKADPNVAKAVSALEIKKLHYDMQSVANTRDSLKKQIDIEVEEINQQKKTVNSLKAEMDNALVNLNLTTVRAPNDGVIDNMYISIGTPVKIHEPLFSFIDTSDWWVQANFNETDLRRVRPGDKVTIMLRMYYFDRIFHGEVVNTLWAAERQNTSSRSQIQKIGDEIGRAHV